MGWLPWPISDQVFREVVTAGVLVIAVAFTTRVVDALPRPRRSTPHWENQDCSG